MKFSTLAIVAAFGIASTECGGHGLRYDDDVKVVAVSSPVVVVKDAGWRGYPAHHEKYEAIASSQAYSNKVVRNELSQLADQQALANVNNAIGIHEIKEQAEKQAWWAGRDFDGRWWNGSGWVAVRWDSKNWDRTWWSGKKWVPENWEGKYWNGRNWSGKWWNGNAWISRVWEGRDDDNCWWNGREVDGKWFNGKSWVARNWTSKWWDGNWGSIRNWNNKRWSH